MNGMRISALLLLAAALAAPRSALAQAGAASVAATRSIPTLQEMLDGARDDRRHSPAVVAMRQDDPAIEGIMIGAAVGALGGMIVAPYLLCGKGFDDSECVQIVRVAVGVPILVGSAIAGGLVDKFHVQGPVVWTSRSRNARARVGAFPRGGAGVQVTVAIR
jgi:hypothetical protein